MRPLLAREGIGLAFLCVSGTIFPSQTWDRDGQQIYLVISHPFRGMTVEEK